jgi:hypothetical protein
MRRGPSRPGITAKGVALTVSLDFRSTGLVCALRVALRTILADGEPERMLS